jgi:hypothetical protein
LPHRQVLPVVLRRLPGGRWKKHSKIAARYLARRLLQLLRIITE